MREDVFLENLLKILTRGSWNFTGEEARVFSHIFSMLESKYKAAKTPKEVKPAITKPKEKKK